MNPNLRFSLILFLTGCAGMMLELTANRVLAPWLGTGQIVWTSIIAVILGALSAGYYWGGSKTAKNAGAKQGFLWLLIAAAWIVIGALMGDPVLKSISGSVKDLRVSSLIGVLFLYALPSFLGAAVFPLVVQLSRVKNEGEGHHVGRLYAWSTLGSLLGTLMAGHWLIGIMGHKALLLCSAAGLILAAVLLFQNWKTAPLILVPFAALPLKGNSTQSLLDTDTAYNRIQIREGYDPQSKQPTVTMRIGNEQTSSKGKNFDLLMPDYNRFFMLADHFHPAPQSMLVIGGGGYCFPQHFLKEHPATRMEVIELDPGVTELATRYFGLDPKSLSIHHEDARPFLNNATTTYDVIIGDAFKAVATVPFTLLSEEAFEQYYRLLDSNGVYMLNLVTAARGPKSELMASVYQTAKQVFPQVYLFPLSKEPDKLQNVVLVAIKSNQEPSWQHPEQLGQIYLNQKMQEEPGKGILLTDNFAPVEAFAVKMLR